MATKKKQAPKSDLLITAAETIGTALGTLVNAVRHATAPAKKKAVVKRAAKKKPTAKKQAPAKKKAPAQKKKSPKK